MSESVARGSIVLDVDASQLNQGLSKAAHKAKAAGKSMSENFKTAAGESDIAGTAEGSARIDQHFKQIAGSAEQLQTKLKDVKAKQEDWDSWGNWDSWSTWMVGGHGDRKKAMEEEAKALKADADNARKAAEARDKLKESMKIAADTGTRNFVQEMNDAVAVMKGASSDMLKIEGMKRKGGFSEDQINQMRAAVGMKIAAESAKEMADATKSADDVIKGLTDDIGELGGIAKQTAEESKLAELMQKGIDQEQIDRIQKLIDLKKKLSKTYTVNTALQKGTAAEISFQNKDKFEQQKRADVLKELELLKAQNNKLDKIANGIEKMAAAERMEF